MKVELPPGYCYECQKKSLDRVDLAVEAEEKIKALKKRMLVSFMTGDRDGALAEVSYQLGITPGELSISGPWESPELTREMAAAILEEILHKFPSLLESFYNRTGFYEQAKRRDELRQQEMNRYNNRMRDFGRGPTVDDYRRAGIDLREEDRITPAKRDFYIPPYTVKKNERPS